MSKAETRAIEKNLERSVTLHRYLLSHPEELEKLPKGAKIFLDKSMPLGNEKKAYRAEQKGNKWVLRAV